MRQALKWYDSKQYIRDTHGAHGLPVKCFEYIVQGLEQGSWEIPPRYHLPILMLGHANTKQLKRRHVR